jgi:phenylpropionate dioxygenase-like ring-hydroxylating dioxygenase large terminal subunit
MNLLQTKPTFVQLTTAPELSPTLPSWVYRDSDVLALERECVFGRNWIFVAHASEIAVGQSFHGDINGEPVVLFRDHNGCLSATCSNPTSRDPGLRVETLAGLVFVNMDSQAAGLAAQAPDLEASIRDFVPAADTLVKCHETVHEVASNWKVLVENSLECYHCEPCHPGFSTDVDMEHYRSVSDGIVTIHTSQRQQALKTADNNPADAALVDKFMYWYVWPSTEIDATPGEQPQLSIYTRKALGPGRHQLIGRYYRMPGDVLSSADQQSLDEDATVLEDIAICEAVQRGLASRGYSQGRFIVDAERSHISEHSVHHFQCMVSDALELR